MKKMALVVLLAMLAGVVYAGTPWVSGLKGEEEDKISVKFSGRIMADVNAADSGIWPEQLGTEFRRLRLSLSGRMYENVVFKTQFEFGAVGVTAKSGPALYDDPTTAEDDIEGTPLTVVTKAGKGVTLKDVYIGVKCPSLGTICAGNKNMALSLDDTTSSRHITFIERALPTTADITPYWQMGVSLHNSLLDDTLHYQVGIYNDGNGGYSQGPSLGYGGRVSVQPVADDNLAVHVGTGAWYRDLDEAAFSTRPELHMAPAHIGGSLPSDAVVAFALETGVSVGPAHAQAEYVGAYVDAAEGSADANIGGYYVQAGVFLTGEHRRIRDTWQRVKPKENFAPGTGIGAWELKARYSNLDLNNGGMSGGVENNVTVGVNWYLNPYARVTCDYIFIDVKGGENGDVSGSGGAVRFATDF
ncbi:MAG: hypothetical protein HQ559_16385 [Lentisphaerae bacterium]|nr:hypothetical protein [Lentisphaerota bacterium]